MTTQITNGKITEVLNFSIQQIFAESYWEDYFLEKNKHQPPFNNDQLDDLNILAKTALMKGNSHLDPYREENGQRIYQGGYAKLTDTLANEAINKYEIVDYIGNQPAGFSAILLKDKNSGEYTLSFRSTEYRDDFYRDALGADQEISARGFAYGQISEMEKYYAHLKSNVLPSNTQINISGYSLGGHLAYAFYVLHPDDVKKGYMENAAGIGTIGKVGDDQLTIDNYKNQLTNANLRFTSIKDDFINSLFGSEVKSHLNSSNIDLILNSLIYAANNNIAVVVSNLNGQNNYIANLIASKITEISTSSDTTKANPFLNSLNDFKKAIKDNFYNNNFFINTENQSIYQDTRYKLSLDIVQKEYNSKSLPTFFRFTDKFSAGDGGLTVNTIFDKDKITAISGLATRSFWATGDQNIVSKSNLHAEVTDIFIEDQNELIEWMGRIPIAENLSKNWKGDFGNTHSITLLIDSLRATETIKKLIHTIDIDQRIASDIFNSASNQHAFIHSGFYNTDTVESNSISNVIDSIYRVLILPNNQQPSIKDTEFTRKYDYLGNIDKRNNLHIKENLINAVSSNNPNIELVPLYDSTKLTNKITSPTLILEKALQQNPEGLAYRYALREMNNFVLLNANYDNHNLNGQLNIDRHSEYWYKAKAEILYNNILNNIRNSDLYYSEDGDYGVISDDVSFRKIKYESNVLGVKKFENFNTVLNKFLLDANYTSTFRNKTIFSDDSIQPYYIPNLNNQVINTQSYSDTKYNDFIFMGNRVNTLLLTGGNDTIETGNQYNFINAYGVKNKSSLNLALYGNNTINLSSSYYGGQVFYKNKELTGGVVQSDGSYVDYNYSNVTYKFKYEGRNILEIKYLNEDNTINITTIDNYNFTSNLFGLNFNHSPILNANRALIDLEYIPQNNPYIDSNATLIQKSIIGYNGSTPIYQQYVTGLFSAAYPTMVLQQSGDYIHSYNVENNTSMKAHISDVSPEILQELNPKNISLYESYNIVYFRPQDKIMIPANMHFLGSSVSRLGDDLIVLNNTGNVAPITLKNYFKFNHQNETNIWFMDENKNPTSQLSNADILKYDTLSATNDNDIVNAGSFSTVIDTLGDDNYTSGTQNTTFIDIPYGMHKQSNDIYNSGTGNNRFIFGTAYGSGNDIINNIKSTDKIILFKDYPSSNLTLQNAVLESYSTASLQTILNDLKVQLVKEGNDLIIRNNNTATNFSLLVKDYYIVFTNPSQHSGIYIEDVYGKSHLLDISDFENFENTHKIFNPNDQGNYTLESDSPINKINTNGANVDVKIKKPSTEIDTGRGGHTIVEVNSANNPTTIEEGTIIKVNGANNPQDINEVTILQVEGFNKGTDTISFENTNISDTVMTQEGNDLYIRIFINNNITTTALVKDYFLTPSNRTGIEVYNGVRTPSISTGVFNSIIAVHNITSNQNNAYIDASNINKNTNIVSTGNGASIIGGKFNDNITAGNGDDRFIMSMGLDTYHLTSSSGIDDMVFNKETLRKGAAIIIQYDNSVTAQDIKMYYDKYDEVFTIKVNNDNGLIITNIDQNAAYSIEQFMEIKLANGTNILKQTYQIESGAPFTYEGIPNKVLLGTSGNDVLDGYVKNHDAKNYLVFGGDGNDEITGNFNTMKNGDYKASLLVGGKGNDEIYAGNYDIVMARKGDGADTIYYDNNHEDFILNVFKENTTPNAFAVKTVGNSLEIYYANNTTDKMILDNYWNLVKDNLHIAVNDMGPNNSSHLRAYSINEVMEELGLNKNNMGNNIHVVEYEDIKNLIARESTDKLIGGELAGYYAELGSFTGFSAGGAVDILNKFDNELLMPKSGMNDPSDFRKL